MEIRAEAEVQFTGERSFWIFPTLLADCEVVIHGSTHRRLERFHGFAFEVDLVPEVDNMSRKQPKFRVEFDNTCVTLVLDHELISSDRCSEEPELLQVYSDSLHEPYAAFSAWVRTIDRQLPVIQHERHGGYGTFVDLRPEVPQQPLDLLPVQSRIEAADLLEGVLMLRHGTNV